MSWRRKKQQQDKTRDNILDLDTVVWRGISPMERIERLAAIAEQEGDINEGRIAPPVKNNYVPTTTLPSAPLPVKHDTRFVPADEPYLTPQDEFPEDETIEAKISHDTTGQISEGHLPAPASLQPVSLPPAHNDMASDVSNAIKTIVADEVGGWLSHNVRRIIAESVTATLTDVSSANTAPDDASPANTAPAETSPTYTSLSGARPKTATKAKLTKKKQAKPQKNIAKSATKATPTKKKQAKPQKNIAKSSAKAVMKTATKKARKALKKSSTTPKNKKTT